MPQLQVYKAPNSGAKMSKISIQQMADRVSGLMEERLNISGNSLETRLRRAGSRLPKQVRVAGDALVAATQMAQSPKLLMQIDPEAVAEAYDTCVKYLNTVNLSARRKAMLLDAGARIAFALLTVGVLVVVVLYWRGFI